MSSCSTKCPRMTSGALQCSTSSSSSSPQASRATAKTRFWSSSSSNWRRGQKMTRRARSNRSCRTTKKTTPSTQQKTRNTSRQTISRKFPPANPLSINPAKTSGAPENRARSARPSISECPRPSLSNHFVSALAIRAGCLSSSRFVLHTQNTCASLCFQVKMRAVMMPISPGQPQPNCTTEARAYKLSNPPLSGMTKKSRASRAS